MLQRITVRLLNHLLLQETWFRSRLEPFSGQTVRFESGALSFSLAIGEHGFFSAAGTQDTPSVTLSLPADWPLQTLTSRSGFLALTRISGAVDFAEALSTLFHHLSWDAESDLSTLIGDVAAYRFIKIGKRFVAWHQASTKRLAFNLTDFFVEENATIAHSDDVAAFCTEVNVVREECNRLENRLLRLKSK